MLRKIACCLIVLLLVFVSVPLKAESFEAVLLESSPVTAGVFKNEYRWETSSGAVNIFVIEVDLKNPNVQVDVIPGGGKLTQRLNVSAMAKASGALAAVNGDFYNTQAEGVPIGPMVINQRLASSPSFLKGMYALGIDKNREAHIEPFSFSGRVIAPNGMEFALSGLNKAAYWEEPDGIHSHSQKLHLYNDLWGAKTRGHDSHTTPTEMLLEDGQVIEVVEGQYLASAVPEGMEILRGHGKAADFLVENFQAGDSVDLKYSIEPDRDWAMLMGGHGLLLDQGKPVAYTRDSQALGGSRARTAAGINKDGTILYLVGVEGGTDASNGLTLPNLSRFLSELGVYKALNLDGGGSTTMVSRPLGEFGITRVFPTEQATERLVANALGVYSTAPDGSLDGLIISGEGVLLINEIAQYSLKAYDTYYNPVAVEGLDLSWSSTQDLGVFDKAQFFAQVPGKTDIVVSSGAINSAFPIEVVGKDEVSRMGLSASTANLESGSQIPLKLALTTLSGRSKIVPAALVDWEFFGLDGSVDEKGLLTVNGLSGEGLGFVVARYQGFSAPLALQFAEEEQPAAADGLHKTIELTIGKKLMQVDDQEWEIDVAPVIKDDRTMVPIRFISEALNADVLWKAEDKNATVIQNTRWIDLWPGEDRMVVGGEAVSLDVAPQLLDGRTMLPLRAVAQALDVAVSWDAKTRTVRLE